MSKRRIRFSLASLLIVSTAVVLFLGYREWKRQTIHHEVDALRAEGVLITGWRPRSVWPSVPTSARLVVHQLRDGNTFQLGSRVCDWDETVASCERLDGRLKDFGVGAVDVFCIDTSDVGYLVDDIRHLGRHRAHFRRMSSNARSVGSEAGDD